MSSAIITLEQQFPQFSFAFFFPNEKCIYTVSVSVFQIKGVRFSLCRG